MAEALTNQSDDPALNAFLRRLPPDVTESFTPRQLEALQVALNFQRNKLHPIDIRGSIGAFKFRYYYIVVCGRERRSPSRRIHSVLRWCDYIFLGGVLFVMTCISAFCLYVIKSALGINIFENFSLGLWDWLKGKFM